MGENTSVNEKDNNELWNKLYNLLSENIDNYYNNLNIEVIKTIDDFFTFIKLAPCEYIVVDHNIITILTSEKIINKFDKNLFIKNFDESESICLDDYCFYTVASTESFIEQGIIIGEISVTIHELYDFDPNLWIKPLIPPKNFKDVIASKKIFNIAEEQSQVLKKTRK